jgi:hypothetical protein
MTVVLDLTLSLALLAAVAAGIVWRRTAEVIGREAPAVLRGAPTRVETFSYNESGVLVGHSTRPIEGRADEQSL